MTAAQLPQVLEWACCTTGVESVVFNTRLDKYELSPFLVSVVDTKVMQVAQLCQGHQVPHFLTKSHAYHDSLVLSQKRTLSDSSSGFILLKMPEETFLNNW